jgi:uncharacterized protein (DUF4415 family)
MPGAKPGMTDRETGLPMMPSAIDEDDAPDLSSPDYQAQYVAIALRCGRPQSSAPKVSTTLRLDADIVEHFRAGGPGWQSRINAVMKL